MFQLVAGILPLIVLKNRTKFNLPLLLFLLNSVISTIILFITTNLKINNLTIVCFYIFFSCFTTNLYFYQFKNSNIRFPIYFFVLVFISFFLMEIINGHFPKNAILISNINAVTLSLIFLFNTISNNSFTTNFISTHILIAFAFLFYNSISFVMITKIFYFVKHDIWFIHNYVEGFSKFIFALALWKLPKTSQ